MQRWEYGEVVVSKDRLYETIELLDAAGKEGWETTGVLEENHHYKMYLMKRPVLDERSLDLKFGVESEVKHNHSIQFPCGVRCQNRGTSREITMQNAPAYTT